MDVRISQDLCDDEKVYVQKRLKTVRDCLLSHGIDCKNDEVPRMALLGSGGGERAFISFLSVLRQLGQDNLLDCFLYLAGVSASTWAMSSLYADAHWSKNTMDATSSVLKTLSEGEGVTFTQGVQWLRKRYDEGDMSLSDAWGVITCDIKGGPLETRIFSDEASRDGANPYPLYSAIEREFFDEKKIKELWCELSPHEAGFTEPGAFIKTSLLKRDFEGGCVKCRPKREPMDMVQLQGITGCVLGDWKENIKFIVRCILDWIRKWIESLGSQGEAAPLSGSQGEAAPLSDVLWIVMALVELVEHRNDMDRCYKVLGKLKSILGEDCRKCCPTLHKLDDETWKNMDDRMREQHVENIFEELIRSAAVWGQPLKKCNNILIDVLVVAIYILLLVYKWEFGTVSNFLLHLNDPRVPEEMCRKDKMHLIDAGLFLNSPYPSVLREAREVDIIVSFDFSENEPFKTLEVASDYAHKNGHPFPEVNFRQLEHERQKPKSCYVFEGKGKQPTVIHIPLFNMDNCNNEETIKIETKKYETLQRTYRDKEKINDLAKLAAENVKINREKILNEMKKAVGRRKERK